MSAPMPDPVQMRALAEQLHDAREELEADWQALARDALRDGVLVVMPISEDFDLSWLLCCSKPTRACEKGHPRTKKRVLPCEQCRGHGRDYDGSPCDVCGGSGEVRG